MAQHFQALIEEIEDFPMARLRRIIISTPCVPDYEAGQYAMLTFADYAARPYSIACAPGNPIMEFHIRNVGGGASSYAVNHLRKGDKVLVDAPYGNCVYVRDCQHPIIAVAGGTGLSGMKAIIEEALADSAREAPVDLYAGGRRHNDLYLNDFFHALVKKDSRFSYHPVLSEEMREGFAHGLVADILIDDHADLSGIRLYGAGPVEMLRHLALKALQHGVSKDRLHTDLDQFPLPDESEPAR